MLADPQSVTADAAYTLNRVGSSANSGSFRSSNGAVELNCTTFNNKSRVRHVVKLSHSKVTTDPLFPAQNVPASSNVKLIIDVPSNGTYDQTDVQEVVNALLNNLKASTDANLLKIIGGEH
jgi:hypothetical protein